ncbi:hypothetical protein [Nocardioides albidus]|uniref:hypothetical protein n=1 Tax=Nocardioides albidus TaxID=1517589 RepID=UPI0013051214|nr:hypothetical protein [Nocardioides albidus]
MSRAWKVLLPVAALMVLVGFAAGAVVRAGADEPPARAPIDLGPAPDDTTPATPAAPATSPTPEGAPSTSSAEVITPRPDLGDDRRGRDDRDDRDDDRRGPDDGHGDGHGDGDDTEDDSQDDTEDDTEGRDDDRGDHGHDDD